MQVRSGNIRLKAELGGGPLYDIGIYRINAARHVFGAEPEEVVASLAAGRDRRFKEVEEAASVILRFPGERLATLPRGNQPRQPGSRSTTGDDGHGLAAGARRRPTVEQPDSARETSPTEGAMAKRARTTTRKYGKKAQKSVESAMRRRKRGTLKSGRSGRKVKSRKQAIAIGLSEARKKGAKVPPRKTRRASRRHRNTRRL
jgi:hypothetical protein